MAAALLNRRPGLVSNLPPIQSPRYLLNRNAETNAYDTLIESISRQLLAFRKNL